MELVTKTGVLEEEMAKVAFKIMLEQLVLLHQNDWAHRDIKLEN